MSDDDDIRARCTRCGMSRERRLNYEGGCPMNFPELGCPFYDVTRKVMSMEGLDTADMIGPATVPPLEAFARKIYNEGNSADSSAAYMALVNAGIKP